MYYKAHLIEVVLMAALLAAVGAAVRAMCWIESRRAQAIGSRLYVTNQGEKAVQPGCIPSAATALK